MNGLQINMVVANNHSPSIERGNYINCRACRAKKLRISQCLNGETLAASAGTGSIRINKLKTFAVEAVGKVKDGAQQVK